MNATLSLVISGSDAEVQAIKREYYEWKRQRVSEFCRAEHHERKRRQIDTAMESDLEWEGEDRTTFEHLFEELIEVVDWGEFHDQWGRAPIIFEKHDVEWLIAFLEEKKAELDEKWNRGEEPWGTSAECIMELHTLALCKFARKKSLPVRFIQ